METFKFKGVFVEAEVRYYKCRQCHSEITDPDFDSTESIRKSYERVKGKALMTKEFEDEDLEEKMPENPFKSFLTQTEKDYFLNRIDEALSFSAESGLIKKWWLLGKAELGASRESCIREELVKIALQEHDGVVFRYTTRRDHRAHSLTGMFSALARAGVDVEDVCMFVSKELGLKTTYTIKKRFWLFESTYIKIDFSQRV